MGMRVEDLPTLNRKDRGDGTCGSVLLGPLVLQIPPSCDYSGICSVVPVRSFQRKMKCGACGRLKNIALSPGPTALFRPCKEKLGLWLDSTTFRRPIAS